MAAGTSAQHNSPGIQIRHLLPLLPRPMAVAHRYSQAPSMAVASVLDVLADFAS